LSQEDSDAAGDASRSVRKSSSRGDDELGDHARGEDALRMVCVRANEWRSLR
jgi:hypothetical protein